MRRSRTIAIAAVSVLAAVGGAVGAIGIGPSAGAEPAGIHLQARQDIGLTVIPCAECTLRPMGFTLGDHIGEFLVNQGSLIDDRGRTVGHYAAHILGTTVATDVPPQVQLTTTLSLVGGQITAQGLEEPPTDGGTIAITGGTGRYIGAKGEMRFHDTGETTTDITLVLR
jgi:hypothetical protein